jgi:hypothetical protein
MSRTPLGALPADKPCGSENPSDLRMKEAPSRAHDRHSQPARRNQSSHTGHSGRTSLKTYRDRQHVEHVTGSAWNGRPGLAAARAVSLRIGAAERQRPTRRRCVATRCETSRLSVPADQHEPLWDKANVARHVRVRRCRPFCQVDGQIVGQLDFVPVQSDVSHHQFQKEVHSDRR